MCNYWLTKNRYRLQNGSLFRGHSYQLGEKFRILIDENKNIHWTELAKGDLYSSQPVQKAIMPGKSKNTRP